jgi:glycine cleavage system H protein
MVILLVCVTIGVALVVDLLQRRRSAAATPAEQAVKAPGVDIAQCYFHPGHSWVQIEDRNNVTVGSDEIATGLVGRVETIEIPAPGTRINQGESFAILGRGSRRLTLVAPVSGVLAQVNPRLAGNPALLSDSPYEQGWIARLLPTRIGSEINNLLKGVVAARWRDSVRAEIARRLAPRMGVVLQDGGEWIDNMGDLLSDSDWHELVRALFPMQRAGQSITTSSQGQ